MGSGDHTGIVHGVEISHPDAQLLSGDRSTKRELIAYLSAAGDHLVRELVDRPLSVIRVPGDGVPFMQKNTPKGAPKFVATSTFWSEASHREVAYTLCNNMRTLIWLGNQRAVEFHPALVTSTRPDHMDHVVLDIDPPSGDAFDAAVGAAQLVKRVLDDVGLLGVVKTSGAKGIHVFVPVGPRVTLVDAAATTRAVAVRAAALDPNLATTEFKKVDRRGRVFIDATRVGSATVVAAFSPRARPGLPVSFPLRWEQLDRVHPTDFTIHTVVDRLTEAGPWLDAVTANETIPEDLLAQGRALVTGPINGMRPVDR